MKPAINWAVSAVWADVFAWGIMLVWGTLPGVLRTQPQWTNNGSPVLFTNSSTASVGIGTSSPLVSLDVRLGGPSGFPQFGVADASDYLSFFASGTYGPALYWDPNAALRLGTGGAGLYNPYGFTERMRITPGGNVGIGTQTPQYKLSVIGTVHANEVIVDTATSDYVFAPGYRLAPLNEVGAYIREHHHLPEIPSEKEVEEKGVSLGEMQAKLLAKIEELTLHMIQAEERNDRLEQQNREMKERLLRLEAAVPNARY